MDSSQFTADRVPAMFDVIIAGCGPTGRRRPAGGFFAAIRKPPPEGLDSAHADPAGSASPPTDFAGEAPAELARLLHESARHVVPELGDSPIAQTRISDRPIPADGFPSVGAVPSVRGYYEAAFHSGITLGPVIGRLLASEILSGRRAAMLADFRPDRFPP